MAPISSVRCLMVAVPTATDIASLLFQPVRHSAAIRTTATVDD